MDKYDVNGLAKYYGPIWMWYSFGQPFVAISNSELTKKIVTLKPNKMNQPHAIGRPINGKHELIVTSNDDETAAFAFDPYYKSWHKRRKLVHSALITMCTSTYINDIIDQIMYKTVFPEIDRLIEKKQGRLYIIYPIYPLIFDTIYWSS